MPIYQRDEKTIHFIHIPKTAGMSTRFMLKASGWHNVYDDQKDSLLVGEGKFYHGHMPYSYWKDWKPAQEAIFEFTVVRNPVQRINSLIHMWLTKKWNDDWHAASKGGNEWNNRNVRKFLFDSGALSSVDANDSELYASVILNIGFDLGDDQYHSDITYPWGTESSDKLLRSVGINSREEYESTIIKGQGMCVRHYTEQSLKVNVNPELDQITWIDLLRFYFQNRDIENVERSGVSPCPMYLYGSERTKVYRMEAMQDMVDDLHRLGAIRIKEAAPPVNMAINKFEVQKESSWSDDPEVRDTFFGLYSQDFEQFGYEKSTPFPLMKSS